MGLWSQAVEKWVARLDKATTIVDVCDGTGRTVLQTVPVGAEGLEMVGPMIVDACETLTEAAGAAQRFRLLARCEITDKRTKKTTSTIVASLPVTSEYERPKTAAEQHQAVLYGQEQSLVRIALQALENNNASVHEAHRSSLTAVQKALEAANKRNDELTVERDRLEEQVRTLKSAAEEAIDLAETSTKLAEKKQAQGSSARDQAMKLVEGLLETHGPEIMKSVLGHFVGRTPDVAPPAPAAPPPQRANVTQAAPPPAAAPDPVVEVTGTVVDMPRPAN